VVRTAARQTQVPALATKEDDVLTYMQQAARDMVAPAAGSLADRGESGRDLLSAVIASLEDDKAEEIVTIDLKGRSSMADQMVVCSGRSTRQVSAISEKLIDRLKQEFGFSPRSEGLETGDWVLIDCGDVIVHVFRPEVREFYQLEKLWQPATAPERPAPL